MHLLRLALLALGLAPSASSLAAPAAGEGEDAPTSHLLATIPDDLELSRSTPGPDGSVDTDRTRFVFGSGGSFVAYSAFRGSKGVAVVGNDVLGEFHYLQQPVTDVTRRHHAFRAGNRVSDTRERWWAIVDGEAGKAYDWIGEVSVGAAGHAAFWEQPGAEIARDGIYAQGAMVFWCGGKKGKEMQQAHALLAPSWSDDGKVVATVGGSAQMQVLLATRRKQTLEKRTYVAIEDCVLSPDGDDVALTVVEGGAPLPPGIPAPPGMPVGRWRVEVDGDLLGEETDGAGAPAWSSDGKRLAFKFVRGGRMGLALRGERLPEPTHEFVGDPVFDPAGKELVYVSSTGAGVPEHARLRRGADAFARGGRFALHRRSLRGGEEETLVEGVAGLAEPTFGPRKRLAWIERVDGGACVVCGEVRSDVYDEVAGLEFSEDGGRLAFGARAGRELWWHVLPLP